MSVNRYDPGYLTSLLKDMQQGDPDAYAGIFAATFPKAYEKAITTLKDKYAAQDAVKAIYVKLFSVGENIIPDGKVFLRQLDNVTNQGGEGMKEYDHVGNEEITDANREMSNEEAGFLLEDIFSTLHMESGELPLDALVSYNDYRKSRTLTQRIFLVVIILLIAALPLYLIPPKVSVSLDSEASEWAPTYTVETQSLFSVDSIIAYIGYDLMPVTQNEDGDYVITPSEAGDMTVEITLTTGRTAETSVTVDKVDVTTPQLVSYYAENGFLYVYATDDESGINYDGIYAVDETGETLYPVSYSADEGMIVFNMLENNTNIYIPDNVGNELQIICSR